MKKNTANTDSRYDWIYNPNFIGVGYQPKREEPKPGKVANVIAYVIVGILLIGAFSIWLLTLGALISIAFSLAFGKSVAAAALFNIALASMGGAKATK
jgi:hypothetical protein